MRVNIYEEEITPDVQVVTTKVKEGPNTGKEFQGVRFFLHSPEQLHDSAADDDRSAVTFWLRDKAKAVRFFEGVIAQIQRGK